MREMIDEENNYKINFCLDRNCNRANDKKSDNKSMIMDLWKQ